jgi:hypothetical protein
MIQQGQVFKLRTTGSVPTATTAAPSSTLLPSRSPAPRCTSEQSPMAGERGRLIASRRYLTLLRASSWQLSSQHQP